MCLTSQWGGNWNDWILLCPRSLKWKNKVKIHVPFQCLSVWLTFSSFILVLPSSLRTSPPRAGRRMTRRAYGHSRACKPKFQFCFEGWETIFYIIFLKKKKWLHSSVVLCACSIVLTDVCDCALCLLLCSVSAECPRALVIPKSPVHPASPSYPNHTIALPCCGWVNMI